MRCELSRHATKQGGNMTLNNAFDGANFIGIINITDFLKLGDVYEYIA